MLRAKLNANRAGFTLLESMIALGLIGVILAAVMVYISQTNGQNLYTEAVNNRMSMAQNLARTMGDFDNIVASAKASPQNAMLRVCLGLQPGKCTATNSASPQSFELFAVRGTSKVGGTSINPVLYTRIGGSNCTPLAGSNNCPFWEVRTSFYASCPGNVASCDQASTVTLKFAIKPAKEEYISKKLAGQEMSTSHKVFKLALKTPQDCPVGSQQTGLGADGLVKCVCRPGFLSTGLTPEGQPVCTSIADARCKDMEILKGRNPDGGPVCAPVVKKCGWQNFDSDAARCPNAGWMEKIDLGMCRPKPKSDKSKSSSRAIKCDRNRGYCCWYEEK